MATRLNVGGYCVVLLVLVALGAGCEDKNKLTIARLEKDNADLNGQVSAARGDLAKAMADNQQLTSQLSGKDSEISRLNAELAKRGKGGAVDSGKAPVAGAGGEWEHGLIGDRVTLESDILFASGKADLTAAGKTHLDKIAADLKRSYGGMPVRVYGYTDADKISKTKNLWTDNLDLSANRAMAVTRYLQSKGVPPASIETVAMGEYHLVAGNKEKSRRVEIVVIKSGGASAGKAKAKGSPAGEAN